MKIAVLSGPCRNEDRHVRAEPGSGFRLISLLCVLYRPMDLTSIKRNLSKGHIQSMAQFQCSLMLMFQNAVMYNSCNHHVHRMALEMQREVLEQMQMLGEALLCSEDRLRLGRR